QKLAEVGLDKKLFEEINRQIEAQGLSVKKGTLIDATIIQAAAKAPKGDDGALSDVDPEAGWAKKKTASAPMVTRGTSAWTKARTSSGPQPLPVVTCMTAWSSRSSSWAMRRRLTRTKPILAWSTGPSLPARGSRTGSCTRQPEASL